MSSSRRHSTGTLRGSRTQRSAEAAGVLESTGEPGASAAAAGTMMHLGLELRREVLGPQLLHLEAAATASTTSGRNQRREHLEDDRARVRTSCSDIRSVTCRTNVR